MAFYDIIPVHITLSIRYTMLPLRNVCIIYCSENASIVRTERFFEGIFLKYEFSEIEIFSNFIFKDCISSFLDAHLTSTLHTVLQLYFCQEYS